MRVIHWIDLRDFRTSGMMIRTRELIEHERKAGIDAHAVSPIQDMSDGATLQDGFKLEGWDFPTKDDIHVIHDGIPPNFNDYDKRVCILHGTPEHTFILEKDYGVDSYSKTLRMIRECEYSVTMYRRHLPYWKAFATEKDAVRYVPSGVDLDRWSPHGPKTDFKPNSVTYADLNRTVKSAWGFLFAIKNACEKRKDLHFNLYSVSPQQQGLWDITIQLLGIKPLLDTFQVGPILNIENVYRGSSLLVSHAMYGDVSRVAMEAMACGCPTLVPEGMNGLGIQYKDGFVNGTSALQNGIITVLNINDRDPDKLRIEAREIAEKHYDIEESVKGLIEIFDKF